MCEHQSHTHHPSTHQNCPSVITSSKRPKTRGEEDGRGERQMKLLRGQWFCSLAIHLLSPREAAERRECCWVITSQRAALLHYVPQLQSSETSVIQSGKRRAGHAERKMAVRARTCVKQSERGWLGSFPCPIRKRFQIWFILCRERQLF